MPRMTPSSVVLPDLDRLDSQSLKALVVEKHTLVIEKQAELASQQDEIQRLKLFIAKLQRMQFGPSSERLAQHIDQLELQLEDLETTKTAKAFPVVAPQPVPAAQPARKPLREDLPREIETLPPKETACPDCGGMLKHLGEDVSEMLEFVPGRFKVIRTVRPKLACNGCDVIVQQPAPHRPIDRGLAGPGLLAHVLVGKYADHLPLYRQSEIYAREGIDLDRSTLAGWVGRASRVLEPLVDAVREYVLDAMKIHADDIPVPVLAPGNGKTRTGRLWTEHRKR